MIFRVAHRDHIAEFDGTILDESPVFFRIRRADNGAEMLLGKFWVIEVEAVQ